MLRKRQVRCYGWRINSMKKLISIAVLLVFICTLSGCKEILDNVSGTYEPIDVVNGTELNCNEYTDCELPIEYEATLWFGKSDNDNINVLCMTDKGYSLFDLNTQKASANFELDTNGYFIRKQEYLGIYDDKFYIYTDMYKEDCVINKKYNSEGELVSSGIAIGPGDEERKVIALDKTLSIIDEYDLNRIFFDSQDVVAGETGICIEGSCIWMANSNQICKYDMKLSKEEILDSKIKASLKNITITQMVASEDGNKIVFLGDLLDDEDSQVYGIIDVKTAEVQIEHTKTYFTNTLNKSGNWAYITDGENPKTGKSTGEVICINMDNMKISAFTVDNIESTNALLDANSNKMIAAYRMDDIISSTRIRCYDFHTEDSEWEYQSPEGKLMKIDVVDQKIFLCFFRKDKKFHIIQLDLASGESQLNN